MTTYLDEVFCRYMQRSSLRIRELGGDTPETGRGGTLLRREKIKARNVPSGNVPSGNVPSGNVPSGGVPYGNVPPVVLIYDGECPVCQGAADWIRARSGPDDFEFFSCHSKDLPLRFPQIGKKACLEAMHLVLPDGKVLAGEQAAPEILLRLRRWRWAAALFRLPGAGILSGAFYRWFAARRHRISRRFQKPTR